MTVESLEKGTKSTEISRYYEASVAGYTRWSQIPENLDEPYALHTGLYHNESATGDYEALCAMNELIIEMLDIQETTTVLEAGCGVGNMSFYIAQRYSNASVYGYDLTSLHISRAKGYQQRNRLQNLAYFRANYNCVPMRSQSADRIIYLESFSHSENTPLTLRESSRLLNQNGRLLIVDIFLTNDGLATEECDYLRDLQGGMYLFGLINMNAFSQQANAAGLTIMDINDITEQKLLAARRMGENAKQKLSQIPNDSEIFVRARKASYAAYQLMLSGQLRYCCYTMCK